MISYSICPMITKNTLNLKEELLEKGGSNY